MYIHKCVHVRYIGSAQDSVAPANSIWWYEVVFCELRHWASLVNMMGKSEVECLSGQTSIHSTGALIKTSCG